MCIKKKHFLQKTGSRLAPCLAAVQEYVTFGPSVVKYSQLRKQLPVTRPYLAALIVCHL